MGRGRWARSGKASVFRGYWKAKNHTEKWCEWGDVWDFPRAVRARRRAGGMGMVGRARRT